MPYTILLPIPIAFAVVTFKLTQRTHYITYRCKLLLNLFLYLIELLNRPFGICDKHFVVVCLVRLRLCLFMMVAASGDCPWGCTFSVHS